MAHPALEARHLRKRYTSIDGEPLDILHDADLVIETGTLTAIIGSSGCGKSTLLHLLGGLDRPDAGEVIWGGTSISDLSSSELSKLRNRQIGFVFQFHHLLPEFDALENVCMPSLIAGVGKREAMDRAQSLLERFGLGHRLTHRPSQLSGGEMQRVAIARAMMNRPQVILADEPTGNLDEYNSASLLDMLAELPSLQPCALVIVTHDRAVAKRCGKVLELKHGVLHPAASFDA